LFTIVHRIDNYYNEVVRMTKNINKVIIPNDTTITLTEAYIAFRLNALTLFHNSFKVCEQFIYTHYITKDKRDNIIFIQEAATITLKEFMQTGEWNWMVNREIVLQCLYALYCADKWFGFRHGDLHYRNVMLKKFDKTRKIFIEVNQETSFSFERSSMTSSSSYNKTDPLINYILKDHRDLSLRDDSFETLLTFIYDDNVENKDAEFLETVEDGADYEELFHQDYFKGLKTDTTSIRRFYCLQISGSSKEY